MQYLFLIRTDDDDDAAATEDDDEVREEARAWVDDLQARGARLVGDRLRPPEEARTVRVRNGERLVTEGPFAEAKELVGGFDLIECVDDDEALEIAGRHPVARFGAIEIRRLWPLFDD